jgi:predicted RND superfamily exporter protein
MPRALPPLAVFVALCVLALGLPRLTLDTRNQAYFVAGDPALVAYDDLLETFGSDATVLVLVEVPDAFAPEHLDALLALRAALAGLEGVEAVRSPLDTPIPVDRGGTIHGVRLSDEVPQTDDARSAARARVLGFAPLRGALIDADARWVGLLLTLDPALEDRAARTAFQEALSRTLAAGPWAAYPRAGVGTPLNQVLFARILAREMARNLGLGLALAGALLLLMFRSGRHVLGPLLVVGASLVGTFGAMGLAGVPVTTVSSILLTFLICVGVADAMHLQTQAARARRAGAGAAEAARDAVRATWRPCALTSATTAAGFLALLLSDLAPVRHLGAFAAFGTLLALAVTFALLPALLRAGAGEPEAPPAPQPREPAPDPFDRLLARLLAGVERRPVAVALACLLLLGAAAAGAHRLRVDHDFLAYLDPDEPLRQDLTFVQERIGGAVAVELVIDTGRSQGLHDGEVLARLDGLTRWLEGVDPIVRAVDSLAEPLAELHLLYGGARGLPSEDAAVAQLLLLQQLTDPEGFRARATVDEAATRVTVRLDVVGSARYQAVLDAIEAEAQRRFAGVAEVRLTGSAYLLARMKDYVLATQVESFALAFVVVSVLVFVVAGSLRLGAPAVLCSLLPVGAVLGVMGWSGVALEVSNALLATVALGIVVDDSIHMTHALKAGLRRGLSPADALAGALRGAGKAILFSTLILSAAFLAYAPSELSNVRDFGLLAAATFGLALLADLVLLPALVLALPPAQAAGPPAGD